MMVLHEHRPSCSYVYLLVHPHPPLHTDDPAKFAYINCGISRSHGFFLGPDVHVETSVETFTR